MARRGPVRRRRRDDGVAAPGHGPAPGRRGVRIGRSSPPPPWTTAPTRSPSARRLEHAAGLYRGDLLPASYDDWVVAERERLVVRHQRVLDRLIGLLEQAGRLPGGDRARPAAAAARPARRARLSLADATPRPQPGPRGGAARLPGLRRGPRARARRRARARATRSWRAPDRTPRRPAGGASGPVAAARLGATPGPQLAVVTVHRAARREWAQVMTAWRRMAGRRGAPRGDPRRGRDRQVAAGGGAVRLGGPAGDRLGEHAARTPPRAGCRTPRSRTGCAAPPLASVLPRLDAGCAERDLAACCRSCWPSDPDLPRPSPRIEDWQRQRVLPGARHGVPGRRAAARAGPRRPPVVRRRHARVAALPAPVRSTARGCSWSGRSGPRRSTAPSGDPPLAALRDTGQLTEIDLGPLDAAETAELAAAGRRPCRCGRSRPAASTPRPRATHCSWSRRCGRSRMRGPDRGSTPWRQPGRRAACRRRSRRSSRPPGAALRAGPRAGLARRHGGRAFTLDVVLASGHDEAASSRAGRAARAAHRPRAGRRRLRLRPRQDPRGRIRAR